MVEAVCFDLDGTLFDDRQYVEAGLRAAARALADAAEGDFEAASAEADLFEAYFEEGVRERTFDHVLDRRGLSTDLVPALVEAYHGHEASLDPYPEAVALLEDLSADYRLGLLTGGTNGREKVERLGLGSYFDAVVVAPDREFTKWDAEAFEALVDELGVSPAKTVYVGDRPELDFPHPNDLGMTTIRIRTGFHSDETPAGEREQPDATVESLSGVRAVLAEL